MKQLFDNYSYKASRMVTKSYSTSFYSGVRFLDKSIRNDIHAIYGFVRFADEIVDSFHRYDKESLMAEFRAETFKSLDEGISMNPILNSFQHTVNKYQIDYELIDAFLHSMEMDLEDQIYDEKLYDQYILGSAEVVGLMCLRVFVHGDQQQYDKLKSYAMTLGSAFQKINFLRDLKDDIGILGRQYFPNLGTEGLNTRSKLGIEAEIDREFKEAYKGILMLPKSSRLGVYVSYVYYTKLLAKIKRKTVEELMGNRIRVPNQKKMALFFTSYMRNLMNLL